MRPLKLDQLIPLTAAFLAMVPSPLPGHGAYHDVVAELTTALAGDPEDVELRLRLATAHVEHGEWRACLDEVARIEALAPGRHPTTYLSGKALAGEGKLEPALVDLDAFLSQEPTHQGALTERARVHLRLGHSADGCEDYRAALASPAGADLYVEAVEALRRNEREEEAFTVAESGVEATRGDPAVLLSALDCAVSLGRIDDALRHLETLTPKWPRPEPWMQRKAEILDGAGRSAEALAAWRDLHDHLMGLPNLERARPFLAEPLAASRRGLGLAGPLPVKASPAVP